MEPVLCEICRKIQKIEDCWCVIDTKTHSRRYECRKLCKSPIPPRRVPDPEPITEPFEISIPDEPETATVQVPIVENWAEPYPRVTLFQQIRNWFQTPTGYTKVKTS